MAINTDIKLRNQVLYSIYVRNHTEEGTFLAIEKDLERIKDLGVDIIWLMPIHPIGEKAKKGSLGCPYAIQDYREVNPSYGTKDDLIHFVDAVHEKGMKCIIDVVYNHTSPDSVLSKEHPEYFYKKADGGFGNKTGDWSDIIDLDYNNKELWQYQIETLCMWAEIVDGFRCDVASLIPIEFWKQARSAVMEVNPNCIWLAESIDVGFIRDNRKRGLVAHSDSELYQAFDICYDYDIFPYFTKYIQGKITLNSYIEMLNFQNNIYPNNYVKLRCIENHDQPRAKSIIPNDSDLKNWTAFLYFQKGITLVYAGQEVENDFVPDLFEKNVVNWDTGKDISGLLRDLYKVKKKEIVAIGDYYLNTDEKNETIIGTYEQERKKLIGVFCLKSQPSNVIVDLPDGKYINLIGKEEITVCDNRVMVNGSPVIIEG